MNAHVLPEVNDDLLSFVDIQEKVVIVAPYSQVSHLLHVGGLIVTNEAYHGCIICKLDDAAVLMSCHTVMCEKTV